MAMSRNQPGVRRPVKRIAVLPTLLTLGNGVCGFAAIAYASKISLDSPVNHRDNNYYLVLSAILILAAMVFDALDGTAARLARAASDFGGQLDSLCDAISFGAAPAFLLLRLGQEWHDRPNVGKSVAVVAAFYLACAVLRLARFNTENSPDPASHKRFKGLPSPAAAGCIASLAILRFQLASVWTGFDEPLVRGFVMVWAPVGAVVLGLLMVSRIPYPHFTRELWRGRRQFQFIVQAVLILCVIALAPELALFLVFWVYALHSVVRSLIVQLRRRAVASHSPELD
jgi:CDP-diacylglycerol--serine O-phosphatidyltransferase